MFKPRIILRNGFKTRAHLSGMERSGVVAANSIISTLEGKMNQLQAEHERALQNLNSDFRELAGAKGLDPNLPMNYYTLKKRSLELQADHIPPDHQDEVPSTPEAEEPAG